MSITLTHSVGSKPKKYTFLIQFKFLLVLIKLILIICIYLTYDENLFSGLSVISERNSDNYLKARSILLSGVSFFAIFTIVEIFILLIGFTYNFTKNNILILSLNIFSIYLLCYFIFDTWHYVTLWYIFIVAQFPQTLLEAYGFFYSLVNEFTKYNKIKNLTLKKIKTN